MTRYVFTRGFSLAVMLLGASAGAQVNVLTQHNDNSRTGANLNETILTTSNVRRGQFGKLFSRAVDAQIYSQPLYVSDLTMADGTTHNVLFVTTQRNSVYAFDATDPNASAPLWKSNLGWAVVVPNDEFGNRYGPYHDLFPELGITGTPVIDLTTNVLYVVAFTKDGGLYHQRLHALDIRSGEEVFPSPVEISGTVDGTGDGSVGGRLTFNPMQHFQRPGLLLSNGVVYVGFASHADTDPYHGWVFAYDALTLDALGIYCTTPNGKEGGIWQSGQGLLADADGDVYFMTGNNFDPIPDVVFQRNFGESFLKLRLQRGAIPFAPPEDTLTVIDYFTPCNQCCLDRSDADLGSAGPVLIPDTDFLFGIGKQGRAYLLNRQALGGYQAGQIGVGCPSADCNSCRDDKVVQRFSATSGNYSSPIFWNSPDGATVYVWANSDRLKAFRMVDGLFKTAPVSQSTVTNPWGGGGLSLSANGSTPGTGIVWGTRPVAGSNPITQMGELYAFDASDLSAMGGNGIWSSNLDDAFDGIGTHAKYNMVTIANGKVYAPSASGQLHVYGLLPNNAPPLVRITVPTTRSQIVGPADITLMATALTRDGASGTSVTFFVDGAVVGESTFPPYQVVWQNAPLGPHTLAAVAVAPNGASATSNPVDVTVVADPPPIGSVISIKLRGAGSDMTADEIAGVGVLARPNWNNAIIPDRNPKEGWLNRIVDDSGTETGARMSWTANSAALIFIPNTPGNFRMMRGYLDTSNTTSTNVTVYDLPQSFTANGYDVYVYFDGDNPTEARTANFRIGPVVVSGTDARGVDFSGTFTQAIADSDGNYLVIPGLTDDRFNLEAFPPVTGGSQRRAPVNSIQIVAHGAP